MLFSYSVTWKVVGSGVEVIKSSHQKLQQIQLMFFSSKLLLTGIYVFHASINAWLATENRVHPKIIAAGC